MFKNLKAKVKQDDKFGGKLPAVDSPVFHNNRVAKSLNENDESKSNSSKLTDDIQANSSDETNSINNNNESLIIDSLSNEKELNNNPVELKNSIEYTKYELKLIQERNENLIEKNKFQTFNETLLNQIDELNDDVRKREEEINQYQIETKKLYENLDEYKLMFNNFEKDIRNLQSEKDELIIKNAELSQKYETLTLINQKNEPNLINNHNHNQTNLKGSNNFEIENSSEKESSLWMRSDFIIPAVSETENINSEFNEKFEQQLEENRSLRSDLNEKNKVIKNLQQRLNDMKKTLQKELNYQNLNFNLPNESIQQKSATSTSTTPNKNTNNTLLNGLHNSSSASVLNSSTSGHNNSITNMKSPGSKSMFNSSSTYNSANSLLKHQNEHLSSLHDDVNFKYLKHVVFKFLSSRDNEAFHLIKALSVLLNFSNDEEKVLKETLEWKMSWFGTRPKIQK